jgi:hypothetical protein
MSKPDKENYDKHFLLFLLLLFEFGKNVVVGKNASLSEF